LRGWFAVFFLGGGGARFCWGFWKKRVVGRGVLVVKLWWIAGESWEIDGQDSGSKNMPLFPDLFLTDSHFGNSVLKIARKIGKVTGINLVDETSELMVISQFGKIIRIDTKSIRAAGRSTRASISSTSNTWTK
jgi:hypothetical protein